MKRTIIFFILVFAFTILLISQKQSNIDASELSEANSIITHASYSNCSDYTWTVTVVKNGGGYSSSCQIIPPGSCKCVVNNAPQGYYTITVDNGQCIAVKYNVYHAAGLTNTDVYVNETLDCY